MVHLKVFLYDDFDVSCLTTFTMKQAQENKSLKDELK